MTQKNRETPMTKVTEAMIEAANNAENVWYGRPLNSRDERMKAIYLAMRSASHSPTTNGEAARIPAAPDDVERVAQAMKRSAGYCSSMLGKLSGQFTDYDWNWLAEAATEALEAARIPAALDVVDLDKMFFETLCKAALESNWVPPEYMANDWILDCAHFLRTGEGIQAVSAIPIPATDGWEFGRAWAKFTSAKHRGADDYEALRAALTDHTTKDDE